MPDFFPPSVSLSQFGCPRESHKCETSPLSAIFKWTREPFKKSFSFLSLAFSIGATKSPRYVVHLLGDKHH